MDIDNLLARINQNDPHAMTELLHDELPRVYNLCLRLCQNQTQAEDLCRDVFVKAIRGIKSFKGESSLSTWLYRLTLNTWKNLVREENNRKLNRHFSIWNKKRDDAEVIKEIDLPESQHTPDVWMQVSDDHKRLLSAVNKLDQTEKAIIVLRDIEGKTYEEISDLLNLNVGTVKSRLSRARDQLKRKFHELGSEIW